MDVLGKLVQGTGCSADGTVAAQNPLSRALDNVLQAQTRGGRGQAHARHGPMGVPPTQVSHQLQMQRENFARGAADQQQMLHAFEQEAMQRGRMEAAFHSQDTKVGPAVMHPHHAAMEAAFEDARFAPPPPPMHAGMHVNHHHAGPMHAHPQHQQDAWVDEFGAMHLNDSWARAGKSHQELAWEEAYNVPQRHFHAQPAVMEAQQAQLDSDAHRQDTMREANAMAAKMRQNPDPKWQQSEFLQFMDQVGTGAVELDEAKNEVNGATATLKSEGALEGAWSGSFDEGKMNRDMFESSWQETKGDAATMEHAFAESAQVSAPHLDGAWDESREAQEKAFAEAWNDPNNLEALWEKAMAEAKSSDPFEDVWEETQSNEYVYQADNPFLEHTENFKRGVSLFESGRLSEAIMAFEAEVQQHPENSEAWRMLGECHAENDEDKSAIICLERAVEEDPYNLSALLALGVSHVNELNPQGALKTLKAWVQHNPKFHGLEIQLDEYSDGSLMDEVMQLMLQAQRHDAQDTDVQVVLGVLYNVSKDYDAAAANLEAAANTRPQEYSLWNKLGATLANSSRSSEAIPSYHKALEIKPRYARGWLNLGISHANLGNYEEATKCYLQALSLNNRAEHIWSYLRICFTCMERFDLIKLSDTRDLALFREEFKLVDL